MAKAELDVEPEIWKLFTVQDYTQYPIIRNGDQRPPVEFLKISKISDSHRF